MIIQPSEKHITVTFEYHSKIVEATKRMLLHTKRRERQSTLIPKLKEQITRNLSI
ncbi:MAG: hypothetical protein SCL54_17315 [Bacillota bacterium]|nr:hypothetical protein [Bacillota bacterium]